MAGVLFPSASVISVRAESNVKSRSYSIGFLKEPLADLEDCFSPKKIDQLAVRSF